MIAAPLTSAEWDALRLLATREADDNRSQPVEHFFRSLAEKCAANEESTWRKERVE